MPVDAETQDFFRMRLDHFMDQRHPLVVLASRLPWQEIEASLAHLFARKARTGKTLPGIDLFGESVQWVPMRPNAGRPRLPLRTIIALLYLKHAFNESDEGVVRRFAETPVWQYFAGHTHFEQALPCDATSLVKFRTLLGEEGLEELLAQTLNAALHMKLIAPKELSTLIVDTTVQPKAVAHPTDAKLVQAAKEAGVPLKQTFAKEGKGLHFMAGRYAHARQFKRLLRVIKRQRTIVARMAREIQRKASTLAQALREGLQAPLAKAQQIVNQSAKRKNDSASPKLYAWHAPEVECIARARAARPTSLA